MKKALVKKVKKTLFIRVLILSVLLTLILSTALSSCGYSLNKLHNVSNNTDQETNDNKDQAQSITNNTINIDGSNNSIAYAAAAGLRSAVSIYCTFETTYGSPTPWNPTPATYSYHTAGSGVIYSLENDGSAFIVTNYHVVYDSNSNTDDHISDTIYIYLYGLEHQAYAIPATFVGGSANYDIAVLRVEKNEILKNAALSGAAAAAVLGEQKDIVPAIATIAIGNPSASEADIGGLSVTQGIVSVDSEYITMNSPDNTGNVEFRVIRTDTPVNSGNSGGGLFNDKGELIGIVNAKISSSKLENIGYAIPIGVVRAVADNIIDHCYNTDCRSVMRAFVGITISPNSLSTSYDEESGEFIRNEEIMVYEIAEGSIGEKALKKNDIIKKITFGETSVDITRQYHLIDTMLDVRAGDTVDFVIVRDGAEMTVSLQITEDCLKAY